jgi:hypothetical protein
LLGLIAASGCSGGGTPATGERAILPATYKQREKEVLDSMRAASKVKARPTSPARPSTRR